MSIQILGLRDHFNSKKNITEKATFFFENKWRAPSVKDLFANIDKYLAEIPQDERYNMFYTVADCLEERGRKLLEQGTIPIDVDDINVDKIDETVEAVLFILKVPREKVGIVFSGNGLQILIGTVHKFSDPQYFQDQREHYGAICERIDEELNKRGLPGHADPSVWSTARLMRLPKTKNIKPGKPERIATLINAVIEDINFSLSAISDLPNVDREDQVSQIVLDRYPPPDVAQVLSDCEFLKRCKSSPADLPEPEWYAMLSILGRLPEGEKLAQEYSKGHPSYTATQTSLKLSQAMAASGPRTCKNINSLWGKCASCKHFGTSVISPIVIKGENYIKTKDTGFHEVKHDPQGNPRPGKPNYEDLRRFFQLEAPYNVQIDGSLVYRFGKSHWEYLQENIIMAYAHEHFEPKASNLMANEFLGAIRRTNLVSSKWFNESTARKINFKNGVLDIDTMLFGPHSPRYGFKYTLPYDYDENATAPRFEQFLREVTLDRQDLIDVLMEFAGYAFSNDSCWAQKALILSGQGRNGKSKFLDVLRALAGKDNYSSVPLGDLKSDVNRYQLDGKLFNLAEETAVNSLLDSSIFKNLVTGGETIVKMLYHQPFSIENRAKLIFGANDLPTTTDTTDALLRRFVIVPFDARFEGANEDKHIVSKLLLELPGIFNLVIRGYKRLIEQHDFSRSETIEKELLNYQEQIDPFMDFIEDRIQIFEESFENLERYFTSFQRIHEDYKEYSEKRSERVLPIQPFVKQLSRKIKNWDKRKDRRGAGEARARGLKGVALRYTAPHLGV